MATGDPANAGANHGQVDQASIQTYTASSAIATTAGNTLIIGVRKGGASAGTCTVEVSEDNGSNFSGATRYGSAHVVTTAGVLWLFYFPSLAGCTTGNLQIRFTYDNTTSLRANWCEYVGALAAGITEVFQDNGLGIVYDSGAMTTSVTSTLIGFTIWGRNQGSNTLVPGTTNALTWTARDVVADTSLTSALFDFNGGGQGAGTYNNLGGWTQSGGPDNAGAAIFSFVTGGAPADENIWVIN